MIARPSNMSLAGTTVALPCFFPSVSSVKTNLLPVDYVELLAAAAHPQLLVSAYDIANSNEEHRQRIDYALKRSKNNGSVVLMDSGKYESFWKKDSAWEVNRFYEVCRAHENDLCFCYDNQEPPATADAIAADAIASVLRDQGHAKGTIVPIVHGPSGLLPAAVKQVAEQLCPVLLAVPERDLGEGIIARARTVRELRAALDELAFYCPLHLLGTGNPLSIIVYTMAGADSFDGLEWCQTVVDHKTGMLFHFQQWDWFREQTQWGSNGSLPYIQSTLMHNLEFYTQFMQDFRGALESGKTQQFLEKFLGIDRARVILPAIGRSE